MRSRAVWRGTRRRTRTAREGRPGCSPQPTSTARRARRPPAADPPCPPCTSNPPAHSTGGTGGCALRTTGASPVDGAAQDRVEAVHLVLGEDGPQRVLLQRRPRDAHSRAAPCPSAALIAASSSSSLERDCLWAPPREITYIKRSHHRVRPSTLGLSLVLLLPREHQASTRAQAGVSV